MSFCPDCALRGKISGLQGCDGGQSQGPCAQLQMVFTPGQLLFSPVTQPEFVYCVQSGYVLLSKQQPGHIIPVAIHQGAQLLGTEMVWQSHYLHWAEALSEVVCCPIPKALFFDPSGNRLLPQYQGYFMSLMLGSLGHAENRLLSGHRMNLQERLIALLQQLADAKQRIPMPLLKAKLPQWLGHTPLQVERTLDQLYAKGILKSQGQDCFVRAW